MSENALAICKSVTERMLPLLVMLARQRNVEFIDILLHHGLLTYLLLLTDTSNGANDDDGISDQRIWSLEQCKQIFSDSIHDLSVLKEKTNDKTLVWDKVGRLYRMLFYVFDIVHHCIISVDGMAQVLQDCSQTSTRMRTQQWFS